MSGKVPTIFERSWKWRRWAFFSQLVIFDVVIVGLVVAPWFIEEDIDTLLNRDIAQAAFLYLTVIFNAYVLGGVWDDKVKGQEITAAGPGTIETKSSETKTIITPSTPTAPVDDLVLDTTVIKTDPNS